MACRLITARDACVRGLRCVQRRVRVQALLAGACACACFVRQWRAALDKRVLCLRRLAKRCRPRAARAATMTKRARGRCRQRRWRGASLPLWLLLLGMARGLLDMMLCGGCRDRRCCDGCRGSHFCAQHATGWPPCRCSTARRQVARPWKTRGSLSGKVRAHALHGSQACVRQNARRPTGNRRARCAPHMLASATPPSILHVCIAGSWGTYHCLCKLVSALCQWLPRALQRCQQRAFQCIHTALHAPAMLKSKPFNCIERADHSAAKLRRTVLCYFRRCLNVFTQQGCRHGAPCAPPRTGTAAAAFAGKQCIMDGVQRQDRGQGWKRLAYGVCKCGCPSARFQHGLGKDLRPQTRGNCM
mmetsp:Transcript_23122/g.68723  ORF Transcript_23122/g.68723 Transcript_23122/m.68723 type:complete len:359 (-) Transcript_23122:1675-2751(-)